MSTRTLAETAASFTTFAAHCLPGSPLYHMLALRIAEDAPLLELAARSRPGQPPSNMLFAAAHELLLRGLEHPVARYYGSVGGASEPGPAAFAAFRDLCLGQRDELLALITTRLTQTNETRRCAYLLPAFATVAASGEGRPLALIEIGPSAGLNMAWDRYCYDYGAGRVVGNLASPVRVDTELRGQNCPPLPERPPAVAWRVGVEQSPIDLEDEAARRWLEALIWPEHRARVERLRAAIAVARAEPTPIVAGDALVLLPELIAAAPQEATLCVYHTHVTYQLSPALREQLDRLLLAASRGRTLLRLSCEGFGKAPPRLELMRYSGGSAEARTLAFVSGHADWVEWQA